MKAYLIGAAGVIFLSVIVSLLLPEGKLNKTITFVMRLICILALVSPVTSVFKFNDADKAADLTDYGYVCEQYSIQQSAQLSGLISKEFSCEADCRVEVVFDDGEFRANGVEVALLQKDKNNIEEIRSYLNGLGYINISVYAKST